MNKNLIEFLNAWEREDSYDELLEHFDDDMEFVYAGGGSYEIERLSWADGEEIDYDTINILEKEYDLYEILWPAIEEYRRWGC